MKRTAGLRRTGRLRAVSKKRRAAKAERDAVYDAVDARSGMRCEVYPALRAIEHHHLFGDRWGPGHTPEQILHVSRKAHEEFHREYAKGKRVATTFNPARGRYDTALVYAASKFAARALGA